jgi:hypothetical protein
MKDETTKKDIMMEAGVDADGDRIGLRIKPDGTTMYQKVLPIEDGKPLRGEPVVLRGSGPIYDVEEFGGTPGKSKGPAKVSTNAYRNGWDNVFAAKNPHDIN